MWRDAASLARMPREAQMHHFDGRQIGSLCGHTPLVGTLTSRWRVVRV